MRRLKDTWFRLYTAYLAGFAGLLLCFTVFFFVTRYAAPGSLLPLRLHTACVTACCFLLAFVFRALTGELVKPGGARTVGGIQAAAAGTALVAALSFHFHSPLVLTGLVVLLGAAFASSLIFMYRNRSTLDFRAESRVALRAVLVTAALLPVDLAEFVIRRTGAEDIPPGMFSVVAYCLALNLANMSWSLRILRGDGGTSTDDEIPPGFLAKFGLTGREREITGFLSRGYSNREIAGYLAISPRTVDRHVYNIYRKCGAGSRIDLVNLLHEHRNDRTTH